MGAQRRIRRSYRRRTISCGTDGRVPLSEIAPAGPNADARVITLRGGSRWLITVVARLLAEDMVVGVETARLVLRFECLTQPHRPVRVAAVRARMLHAVDEEMLRALASVPAARMRQGPMRRLGGGGGEP